MHYIVHYVTNMLSVTEFAFSAGSNACCGRYNTCSIICICYSFEKKPISSFVPIRTIVRISQTRHTKHCFNRCITLLHTACMLNTATESVYHMHECIIVFIRNMHWIYTIICALRARVFALSLSNIFFAHFSTACECFRTILHRSLSGKPERDWGLLYFMHAKTSKTRSPLLLLLAMHLKGPVCNFVGVLQIMTETMVLLLSHLLPAATSGSFA